MCFKCVLLLLGWYWKGGVQVSVSSIARERELEALYIDLANKLLLQTSENAKKCGSVQ